MKLINIGFGNMVSASRLIAIVSPESAPIKRMIQEARERGVLIDATYGRRTRAVLVMDSDHVILSAVQPETVAHRLFNVLRQMDEEGVEALTCEVLPAEGIGLAIMNRLSRAAAFHILDADEEITR